MRMVSVETGEITWTANSNRRPIKPETIGKELDRQMQIYLTTEKCK